MNQLLLDREAGALGSKAFARLEATRLLNSLQLSTTRFDGGEAISARELQDDYNGEKAWASKAGVNALAIDKFESRLMISGGADGSMKLWDLENDLDRSNVYKPTVAHSKNSSPHKFGITKLSFYPFNSKAFLSSSYDHFLKLCSTDTLTESASFDLGSVVYSHSISQTATNLLVACATQHTIVRLVDLRSGARSHSLAGHRGALMSVGWSPSKEHILASGDINGSVRLWDIRSGASSLGVLDLEDSVGVTGYDGLGLGARTNQNGKAHSGAVNGLEWTDDGKYLVTAGHDHRLRVWDMANGRNTLATFPPTLKNSHLSTIPIRVAPTSWTPAGENILFYPNEQEILQFDLHEGRLKKRLRISALASEKSLRTTALAWRATEFGFYSAHADGQIRAWLPQTAEDDLEDAEEALQGNTDEGDESKKRKRKVLDDVFRNLTGKKITFT